MSTRNHSQSQKVKLVLLLLVLIAGAVWWWFYQRGNLSNELAPAPERFRYQEERPLMGTLATITLFAESPAQAEDAFAAAFARGEAINQVASDYLPDSELTRFNSNEADVWFSASEDFLAMVAYGLELATLTDGAYDPTLGAMSHLWRETRKAGRLPSGSTLSEVQSISGWEKIEVDLEGQRLRKKHSDLRLDLGGLGKGYAAEEILRLLVQRGLPQALVVIGGDVRCGEAPPKKEGWTIGLPDYGEDLAATITVVDCAISTSGDTEQFVEIEGKRYAHIIDPATGLGMTDSLLATVVASNGLMADALATAACINPSLFSELSPSTEVHSRILSSASQQVSKGFPPLTPIGSQE